MIEEFNEVSAKMAEPMSDEETEKAMEKMGRLQDQIDASDGWELDRQVEVAMDALVLPADDQKAGTLSGGEARRVALCKLLLQKPDMLLLDEPTNHLDAETVQWLEDTLSSYPGNVIVSTHDRYFLDNITKWILELEKGKGRPFEGNYSSWLEQKAEILRKREKSASTLQKRLQKELQWLRETPGARRKHNKGRVSEYEKLSARKIDMEDNSLEIQIAPGLYCVCVVRREFPSTTAILFADVFARWKRIFLFFSGFRLFVPTRNCSCLRTVGLCPFPVQVSI
jgi:ATPase subunit of ABC transporter with duplicated ATPase domains